MTFLIVNTRRTKLYRRLITPLGYHLARDTKHSSLAIPVCLNGELREMQIVRKQKRGES
jgi:hypothetical protein